MSKTKKSPYERQLHNRPAFSFCIHRKPSVFIVNFRETVHRTEHLWTVLDHPTLGGRQYLRTRCEPEATVSGRETFDLISLNFES
jgi:hypothetical protein